MIKRILTIATLALSALFLFGCEGETKYITTPDIPAAPVGVYSVTGDGFVDIYWPFNNDGGVSESYAVYKYDHTEGDRDVYVVIAEGNEITAIEPDYVNTDEWYGYFRDEDAQNGTKYWYAVSAYNGYGESELSYVDAYDTPRPQGIATARDFHEYPLQGGYDFSRARTVAADESADIWFEYDSNLESFFVWAANVDTDIQPYGPIDDITDIGWGDPGNGSGWSEVGWLELVAGNGYIVWTADNHYACIHITSIDFGSSSVAFTWAYQTVEGEAELKRAPKKSPPHAENYGRRSGN